MCKVGNTINCQILCTIDLCFSLYTSMFLDHLCRRAEHSRHVTLGSAVQSTEAPNIYVVIHIIYIHIEYIYNFIYIYTNTNNCIVWCSLLCSHITARGWLASDCIPLHHSLAEEEANGVEAEASQPGWL